MRSWFLATVLLVAAMAGSPAAAADLDQVEVRSETLSNGLRLVMARTPPVPGREPRVYLGAYVPYGAMQEAYVGQAHLLEHVAANNGSMVPAPPMPEGAKVIEGNALTKPNYTSFVVVVSPDAMARTLHTRIARMGRFQDDPQVLATEKGRVETELLGGRGWPYAAYKALDSMAKGRSPVLQDEIDWVRAAKADDMTPIVAAAYRPERSVVVVTGDVDFDAVLAAAHTAAEKLGPNPYPTRPIPPAHSQRFGAELLQPDQNTSGHAYAGLGWPQPDASSPDAYAFLVLDQLLLGGRTDPDKVTRDDASPLGRRLKARLDGFGLDDSRDAVWGAPPLADGRPSFYSVIFSTDRPFMPSVLVREAHAALTEIRRTMTDAEIAAARDRLAGFYERWFFDANDRILSDHLAAWALAGRDPADVKAIPARIRAVRPDDVRRTLDRYLLGVTPNAVVLPSPPKPAS